MVKYKNNWWDVAMKNLIWGVVITAALSVYAPSLTLAAETEGPKEKSVKILHFGNMGGILPDLSIDDVPNPDSIGANNLFKYCGQCHNVPGPGMRTKEQWEHTFWRMYWRMHLMVSQGDDYIAPDYANGMYIFKYLTHNAMKAVQGRDVDQTKPGANEYLQTCNQCHELPDPTLHKASDWDGVVTRMLGHISSMSKTEPNRFDVDAILGYLKSNAAQ